jgi:ribosomal protein S18 acetylase RimI-like enzyme
MMEGKSNEEIACGIAKCYASQRILLSHTHHRYRAERELHMPTPTIRIAVNADDDRLVEAIIDQQEYERELHDTRLPGAQIGRSYLEYLKTKVAAGNGALLVAELNGAFVGYAACWIEHDNNVAETEDSNHFGYVADTYIVPQLRGRGLVASLLESAEQCIRQNHVSRIRIAGLANNQSALRAYAKYGFGNYEIVMEKRLR